MLDAALEIQQYVGVSTREDLNRDRKLVHSLVRLLEIIGEAATQVENYGGTKGYVMSLSKALAWEWGPAGVRINCIAPGWIVPRYRL